jgi:tRNA A-37 threonylcarbamoyl transferase component Bud32
MKMRPVLIVSSLIIFSILIPAQMSKVNIIIKTNVPGASVTIDDQSKGKTNNSGQIIIPDVDVGRHQVKIARQGYEKITQTIEVDTLNVMFNIKLKKLKEKPKEKPIESKPEVKPEPSKPMQSTYLMIRCNIGSADVYVDGVFKGKTDSRSGNFYLKIKPGKIDSKLEKAGYETYNRSIDAGLGGSIDVPLIKVKQETNILLFVFIAVIGVTALVLIFILLRVLSGARAMGRFGDYQLLKPIGKGGMAAIYKARWMKTNQLVALKVMDASLMHDKELVLKFFSEGKIVSEINKKFPGAPVIRVLEYGRDRIKTLGIPYITMEFFEGTSLSHIITATRIDLQEKIHIIMEVARALGSAHQLGIFHRDITPDNILINGKDVRLIDFGIAEESFNPNTELTDSVTGKPIYMSPEQCAAKGVNGKSDIYSLGVIFYFWVSGHPPFYAKNHLEVMRMHQEVSVPPIDREIPANLNALITAMLDKDPELRPSADELYENLKKMIPE